MTAPAATLDAVVRLVGERTGLTFPDYRADAVARAVDRAGSRLRAADGAALLAALRADPAAFDRLVADLTVGETYFFREPAQFAVVEKQVVPAAMAGRDPGRPFRAWSAACSTGEEPYSLAVLLRSCGLGGRADVLGTDISRAALARAERGRYRDWSLRGAGAERMRPHLRDHDGDLVLADDVRRAVRFAYLNLAEGGYPSSVSGTRDVDLILCRNVLIYFDADTVRAVARRLHDCLAPGGWLLTAACDPPLVGLAPFRVVVTPAGVAYRRDDAAAPRPHAAVPTPAPLAADTPRPSARPAAETDADAVARLRGLAESDPAAAALGCEAAAATFPLSVGLHLLHATLLLGHGDATTAAAAARRALFLEPLSAVGHVTLGLALRGGDETAAARAFRRAVDLAAARPADEPVPHGDGTTAGRLARSAAELASGPGRAS